MVNLCIRIADYLFLVKTKPPARIAAEGEFPLLRGENGVKRLKTAQSSLLFSKKSVQ